MSKHEALVPSEIIEKRILLIRGQKVMLHEELAQLYGVEPRALIQAVKRNAERFPKDFAFQLTKQEVSGLKSQIVISNGATPGNISRCIESFGHLSGTGAMKGRGGARYYPYAFTEQGIAMLSSVLHSRRAVRVNIEIMRAFVKLRQLIQSNSDLARKLDALEEKYDSQFKVVFDVIRQMLQLPGSSSKRQIGFDLSRP